MRIQTQGLALNDLGGFIGQPLHLASVRVCQHHESDSLTSIRNSPATPNCFVGVEVAENEGRTVICTHYQPVSLPYRRYDTEPAAVQDTQRLPIVSVPEYPYSTWWGDLGITVLGIFPKVHSMIFLMVFKWWSIVLLMKWRAWCRGPALLVVVDVPSLASYPGSTLSIY